MIKAVLRNASHPEYGQVTISFPIPDEQYDQTIEMLQAMDLGFSRNRDCMVDDLDSSYSVLKALTDTMVNVDQMNYLAKRLESFCESEKAQCRAIAPMKDADIDKLNAVVYMTDATGITSICQLAENLDQFDFIPDIHTPEEYGRYMIQQSGHFEYDANLEGFYDYRLYGEQHVQAEGGVFNEYGYIAYHGTLTLDELMRADPAEQYQQEQGPQMGGMA